MTSQIDGQDEIASVTTVVGSTQRPNEARLFRFMGTVVSCLVAAMFLPACGTLAQEIAIQRPPYYVGEPVVLQITASGIEGAAPDCRYVGPSNPELQVLGPQVSKSSFSNMQIINGRVTKSESNDYRFSFQVTATVAGELSIGPFELEVDGKTTRIDALRRTFGQLENDPDVLVEVELADDSIYVGQEVPVTIRWGFAGDRDALDHAFNALQIRSPLFD